MQISNSCTIDLKLFSLDSQLPVLPSITTLSGTGTLQVSVRTPSALITVIETCGALTSAVATLESTNSAETETASLVDAGCTGAGQRKSTANTALLPASLFTSDFTVDSIIFTALTT